MQSHAKTQNMASGCMVMQRVGGITWYTGDDDGVIFVAYSLLPIICPKF